MDSIGSQYLLGGIYARPAHALRRRGGFQPAWLCRPVAGYQAFARFNPNPNFAPEQLNGYEVGYRRLFRKNVYVDIATFLNHYHDLFSEDITGGFGIENNPAPPHLLLPAQFRNDLYGRTQGFEIAPEWRPKDFWRLRASWSFLNMHLRATPGTPEVGIGARHRRLQPQK